MLVKFHKGFIMEGITDKVEKKMFGRTEIERNVKIYVSTGVSGICDESEVEEKVAEAVANEMNSDGWGENFQGWKRLISAEEAKAIYDHEYTHLNKITTEPINSWKMDRIIKELTGAQFAQFCKENGIGAECLMR